LEVGSSVKIKSWENFDVLMATGKCGQDSSMEADSMSPYNCIVAERYIMTKSAQTG
jgi:hypothetical protein